MSTSALPTPIAANSSSAAAASGVPATMASGGPPEEDADSHAAGVAAVPGDRRRDQRAGDRAEPDRRVEHADTRVPAAQQVDRHDDHEHRRAAAQGRLHGAEHADEPQPGIRPERSEALDDLPRTAAARPAPVARTLVAQPDEQQRGRQRGERARRERGLGAADGDQAGRGQRSGQRRDRIQQPAHDVRARQLLRRPAQGRQQGRVGGAIQRLRQRRGGDRRIDPRAGSAGCQQSRGGAERRGAHEADAGEHVVAAMTIGQRCGERRREGGGKHAHDGDERNRRGPAIAVGDHRDRHRRAPLGRPHRAE
jgi:hypothetical protein